jgi:hypothetical protein
MSSDNSGLMADYRVFTNRRRGWVKEHKDKVVVVRNRKVLGFYDDYKEGLRAGIAAFGVESKFLVQKIYDDGEAVV